MAYKTINDNFYFDPEIRQLPKIASDLLLYLVLNPHAHFSGVYYLPLANVPIESKLNVKEIDAAINILSGIKNSTIEQENSTIEQNQEVTYRVSDNTNDSKQQKQKPVRVFGNTNDSKQHFFICFESLRQIVYVKSMLRHQTGGRMSERQLRSVLNHLSQFSKSSVIVPFLEYHRDYFIHCFLALEKSSVTADEKRLNANITRRKHLEKEFIDFYNQHGLIFFCSKIYPIRLSQQEEEEAEEEASAYNQNFLDNLEYGKNKMILSKEEKQRISDLCLQLKDMNTGFNPYQFVMKTIKANIPYLVTEDVLTKIVKYKATIKKAWPYAMDILKKQYQQYNYAQALNEHMNYKKPIKLSDIKVID